MASWNEIWNTQLTIPSAKPSSDAKTAKSVVALLFKTVPPESEKDLQELRRYIIDTLNQSVSQFNGTLTQSSQANAGNALTFTTKEINKPLKQDSTETKPSTAQVQYQLKIQASYNLLLHIAEEMGLEKLTTNGDFEPFSYDQRFNFQHLSQEDKFFMASEKLRMLLWKLDHLIVDKDVRFGSVSSLKSGERLISKLKREGVIESVLCLHDNRLRKELHENWIAFSNKSSTGTTWNWVTRQPFHKIRNYFGEKIAMYFAFLEFYTTWLIFPSILGILVTVLGLHELLPLYTLGITIWGCLFCEFWRRKSDDLAYEWRVDLFEEEEEVRPEFVGDIVTDPVTGHKLLYYDPAKRYIQYAKSLPVMLLMLLFAIGGMVFFYKVDDWIDPAHTTYTAIVLYGAFIPAFSYLYKIVAVKLNDLENYRTETEYENHLNIKLFSFEFFNCFCLLFYTAFWKQDIEYLRSLLIGILITRQILGNVLESLLPWYTVKTKLVLEKKRLKRQQGQQTDSQGVNISSIESEQLLAPYEQTYDDYLEMIVQFGYMTLFAVAFPLAPLWAFLNNVVEIRSDAFKLIHASQRPRPQVAENIGIWLKCLEFLNVLAIISNLYFIFFVADNLDSYFADGGKKIWTFVIAEHLFIGFRWLVSFVSSQIATPHLQKIWQQERQVIRKIKKKAN